MTRNHRHPLFAAALLALFTGCSSMDADLGMTGDGGDLDTGFDQDETSLRLDVFPSDATPDLLPQSISLGDGTDWTGLSVDVRPSVRVSGLVTGFQATPYFSSFSDPTVPGEDDVPVAARIDVHKEGSVAGATATTDDSGLFEVIVPAADGYDLVVVPVESALLPFEVRTILLLAGDLELSDLYLDYGAPVWGQVTRSDGTPVTDATVHLVDSESGATGPVALVDDEGRYLLRAYPGDYQLVVKGDVASADPTVVVEAVVEDDDGVRVDVDLGPAYRHGVRGELVDEAGQSLGRVDDYVVRLTSIALGDIDGELVYETDADREGRFSAEVMAGEYLLEVIPAYDAGMSPLSQRVTVSDADINLGDLVVPGRVSWSARIYDPQGAPAPDVLVVAREIGFDGYTYSATSSVDGLLSIELPATAVELTLTPADDRSAITHITYDPASARDSLELASGTTVSGTLEARGEPVPYALVEIRDQDGRLYASGLSDGDGGFRFRVESEPALLP